MTFTKAVIRLRIKAYTMKPTGVDMLEGSREIPEHIQEVEGYTFEAVFSTGQIHLMGVHKNVAKDALHKTNWMITDISTGLGVCEGNTRRDAVKKFQDVYCSKLERMVYDNSHWSSCHDCRENIYEKLQREFSDLLEEHERDMA